MYSTTLEATRPEAVSQLPIPKGYKILIALPKVEEKTEGGIIRPDSLRQREQTASICGYVLKMGGDCYNDPGKFPSGPYCQEGDWVIFGAYSGTRLKIHGQEFRIINDDTVDAVIANPSGIERA